MPHDQIPISPRMSNKLSFPSSLFPQGGGREEAVAAVATESQAPLSLCGNAVLAVMSLAVQGHADIEIPGAGTRPLSLFFLTIGESGERKSTVDSMLSTGIQERERELRKREREARREYDNCQATFDKAKARILNDRKLSQEEQKAEIDNLTDPPPEPLAPLLTVGSDPTFEGIYKLLAAGQPSLGLFSAEGGAFLGGHAMTREHRLRTLTGLSDLWGGSPLYRIRSGDGSSFLLGKRLSFHLAVQPDVASSLLDDPLVKGQGFLSRLLVAHPESTQGTRLYKEPDPANCAMIDAFSAKVLDLLRRSLPLSEDSPTPNELSPRHLPLSVEAKTVWVAFFDEIEAAISTTYADVKGFASKAAEHAARLAGVLTLWDDLDAPSVPLEAMTQGINLARYYLAEHLALTAAKPDPEELIALRIIKWLRDSWKPRHGALISSSDLIQRGPGPVRKAAVAREILSLLVEYGHLAREVAGEVAGKKRKEVYRILEEETPSEF